MCICKDSQEVGATAKHSVGSVGSDPTKNFFESLAKTLRFPWPPLRTLATFFRLCGVRPVPFLAIGVCHTLRRQSPRTGQRPLPSW